MAILGWVTMVNQMFQCPGKQGHNHRANVKYILEKGRPEHIYKAYESYKAYVDYLDRGGERD